MSGEVRGVGLSGIMADMPRPMLEMTTREKYLTKMLESYKEMIRFRAYSLVAFLLGLYFLFSIPLLGIVLLFLGPYYYQEHQAKYNRILKSSRTVMIGH
ncbi:hypothetical protein HUU53_02100 [Candidatus Micrarchaeota archaeon]|nr:hypothetical protein [Candidatus Micrarchaeota archaeon]